MQNEQAKAANVKQQQQAAASQSAAR